MRTITFRRFMTEVETLAEPVQLILTKRDTGEVLTLGEFYPHIGTVKVDPPAQQTLQPARTAPRTFRPVPKPVPTKK